MIYYQTLLTNYLKICMKISMENLHVDIGAQRIKTSISLMLIPISGRKIVHLRCEQSGSHFLHSAQGEWLYGISYMYFLLLSHLLYGISVKIFNMNRYLLELHKGHEFDTPTTYRGGQL